MFINSIESLIRDGYQIHVSLAGEVYVYFSSESQAFQHEVWNRDAELIRVFLAGRYVCGYFSLVAKEIRALSSSPDSSVAESIVAKPVLKPVADKSKPIAQVVAEPAAEVVDEFLAEPAAEPVAETLVFKPELAFCDTPPAQSPDFLEILGGADNEYVVYAKENNSFHIHCKIDRDHAKEVWRRDRPHIQQWLGADADNLNTVSWEPPVGNDNSNAKWKEVSPETTKLSTVVRQFVSFGKPVADLAILEDGSHHVYFYLPRQEAKQIYPNIKGEFAGYEIASVSFE